MALPALLAKLALGPVLDVVGKYIDKQASKDKLAAEIEQALIGAGTEIAARQADIIMAEARGESWLQRNWRPVVALTAFFSCWFVVFPYAFFVKWGLLPQVFFGEKGLEYFFTLTTLCVGGYIGGRSLEKISTTFSGRGK